MIIARQSTARTMMVGPVLDASGVAVTDCVVADFEGSVNGGDPAALNGSATLTHRGVGFYSLALTATDLGTVGQFEVTINDTVNACPMKEITVVEEAVYDALFAASATGLLPANVTQIGGDAQSATDLKDFADAGYDPSTNKVQGVVLVDTLTTYTGNTPQTADHAANITAIKAKTDNLPSDPADQSAVEAAITAATSPLATAANLATVAGYLDTEIAAILADTNELQTDWTNGGRLDLILDATATASELAKVPKSDGTETWNATALASIQSEANDAIVANKLDHLVAVADGDDPVDNSIVAKLASKGATADWSSFVNTTDSLEAIRDRGDAEWVTGAGGGGGGSGARTVTITVNDGSTALQNANVRMIQGAENYVVATNASGVAVFALDDATWSVAITKPGYTFTPTTLVVNGTETQTYSMTAVTITPSSPGQVTGYLTIFGTDGEVEEGVSVHLQQLQPISGTGVGYDGAVRTETSAANGVVEFTNIFKGGRYMLWRGTDTANKKQFTLASNATDPTALGSFVGSP